MSFARQLSLVLFLVVLAALAARTVLTVHETREYLAEQLESHARDAARSLGLSISLHLAEGDHVFMESVVDSLFDSGDYTSIHVHDLDGAVLLARERSPSPSQVPAWFVDLVPIDAPTGDAVLTAGWNTAGRVTVRSYPGYAWRQLWETTVRSVVSAAVFLLVASVVIGIVLRVALKPLDLIERQARAVAERRFPRIEKLPRTREFRRVAEAMNFMTRSVEQFIADQSEQARKLQAEAYLDPVTGLRNRRALLMDVALAGRQARDEGPAAFVLLNVRGLDAINRRGGYESGDAFMCAMGARLAERVRDEAAALGRWGGAIFGVVLPRATQASAGALAEELVAALSAAGDDGVRAEGVNAGVVIVTGNDDAATLVDRCEAALRNAEDSGPGCWHLWQAGATVAAPELHDEALWQDELKRIIAERDVVLEAQPVLARDGGLMHLEVLARLRRGDGTLLPAGRFVPVAVRLGLGSSLDVVILEQVLEHLAVRFQSAERVAVNVSAAAAGDADFLRWLGGRLAREPAARRARLCLEVTEHFAAGNPDGMRALVETLRPLGVNIGVDHCGAAEASLSALRGLPLDYAKLYGALISGIDGDRERQHLLRSLVSIGHGMGLAVVAEFVETEAEHETVHSLGFDAAQGFLLGRPGPLGRDASAEAS